MDYNYWSNRLRSSCISIYKKWKDMKFFNQSEFIGNVNILNIPTHQDEWFNISSNQGYRREDLELCPTLIYLLNQKNPRRTIYSKNLVITSQQPPLQKILEMEKIINRPSNLCTFVETSNFKKN